jgi:hypothetical protein
MRSEVRVDGDLRNPGKERHGALWEQPPCDPTSCPRNLPDGRPAFIAVLGSSGFRRAGRPASQMCWKMPSPGRGSIATRSPTDGKGGVVFRPIAVTRASASRIAFQCPAGPARTAPGRFDE